MWGCEDVYQQMWGCEDVDLQMWRGEDVDQQMWRCEDLDQQMWGCENVLQRLLFYEEPFAGALGKKQVLYGIINEWFTMYLLECTSMQNQAWWNPVYQPLQERLHALRELALTGGLDPQECLGAQQYHT